MLTGERLNSPPGGEIAKVDFERFIQSEENPRPNNRVENFIVNGPYVLFTKGAFETEYLYERNKVLDCDYLAANGGEANIVPHIGMKMKNNYYGNEFLTWRKGINKWNTLRFDGDESEDCDGALFATEQRNCVYYAAVYVDCRRDYDAIISYESSGGLLYLNGEMICCKPYGRVKGLWDWGNNIAASFKKGRNLLLFKIRTGYICDTIDISLSNLAIFPVIAKAGGAGVAQPIKTGAYFGSSETPRQIMPCIVGAFEKVEGGSLEISCNGYKESFDFSALERGECRVINVSVPAKTSCEKRLKASIASGGEKRSGSFMVETDANDGFDGTEHVLSDFHFDTTYHQEQRTYAMGAIYILKSMLEELEKYPDFKAVLSEVDYLHPYYSVFPEDRALLKRVFESGRAEADCFYNQPNEMTSSPEGLVRNLVYGQLYHRDVLGRLAYVYGPGDVFGHPNQLSQICKKGGCTGIYWGKHIFGLNSLFHHMSPDGSTLVHMRGRTGRSQAVKMGLKNCGESSGFTDKYVAYPRRQENSWMKETLNGARFSTMSDLHNGYLADDERITRETGFSAFETTSRDISLYHAGVSLTRTDLKQANRLGENLLITAEKFAAIASLLGADYPEKALDKAWRQLLCGQHHDSITGTNNEISFVDLMIEYREAVSLASDIINRAGAFIASGIKLSKDTYPVVVFNPHSWQRNEPCVIDIPAAEGQNYELCSSKGEAFPLDILPAEKGEKTQKALFVAKAPATGYETYYLTKSSNTAKRPESDNLSAENAFYKITVDPEKGGAIVSVFDKTENRELIKRGGEIDCGQFAALREVADRMETQHEFYTTGQKLLSSSCPASVEKTGGANFEKLIIKTKMGTLVMAVQEITLFAGVKRIDFTTTLEDYLGEDDLFSFVLPLDLKGVRPVFDDRFAPAVRCESRRCLDFRTHQHTMFSHCNVFAANQWLDYGPSVTLKIGQRGKINVGSTALIYPQKSAFANAAKSLSRTLTKKAVPVTPYPDKKRVPMASQIPHFNEDLLNTDTRFVLSLESEKNEYEQKLFTAAEPKALKSFENALAKKGAAVLFCRDEDNQWKKSIDVVLIKAENEEKLCSYIASLERALEKNESAALPNSFISGKAPVADDYGVALLNSGNLACSIEAGGVMNLMLFHTARFYGNQGKVTGGRELVPEQKTHRFSYALVPHSGSYRQAEIYKRALEFNDNLFALSGGIESRKRLLPESKSFLSSGENFIITSLKAGGYPMASMKNAHADIYSRGLTLRGFEENGGNSKAEFEFGFEISSVCSSNLLEENRTEIKAEKNSFSVNVQPHSIETFCVSPVKMKPVGSGKAGAEKEPVEPTYIRSWEHDLGTMPMGYLAAAGSINRRVEELNETSFRVNASMVNNRTDEPISGKMKLVLPEGFKADKCEFDYELEAGAHITYPVKIEKPLPESEGIIRLQYENDGQSFEDIFEIGCANAEVSLKIEEGRVCVKVKNLSADKFSGELALATPIETWGTEKFNPFAFSEISPETQKAELEKGETKEYEFKIKNLPCNARRSFWAAAKLMVNGRLFFAFGRDVGEHHNLWAHVFEKNIFNNGGSLQKVLELD